MCRTGGGGGGIVAKDALGNDVIASEWLKTHGPGDRTLTQGLKVQLSIHAYISLLKRIGISPSVTRTICVQKLSFILCNPKILPNFSLALDLRSFKIWYLKMVTFVNLVWELTAGRSNLPSGGE